MLIEVQQIGTKQIGLWVQFGYVKTILNFGALMMSGGASQTEEGRHDRNKIKGNKCV